MDITGARWGLEGAEAILKLRAVIATGELRRLLALPPPPRARTHPRRALPRKPRPRSVTSSPHRAGTPFVMCFLHLNRAWRGTGSGSWDFLVLASATNGPRLVLNRAVVSQDNAGRWVRDDRPMEECPAAYARPRRQRRPTTRFIKLCPLTTTKSGPMQPANLVVMPIIPPNGLAVGRTRMCVSPVRRPMPREASAHGRRRPWRRKPCHRSGSPFRASLSSLCRSRIWMSFLTLRTPVSSATITSPCRSVPVRTGSGESDVAVLRRRLDPFRYGAAQGQRVAGHGGQGQVVAVIAGPQRDLQMVAHASDTSSASRHRQDLDVLPDSSERPVSTTSPSISSTRSDASTSGSNVRSSMTAARISLDLPICLSAGSAGGRRAVGLVVIAQAIFVGGVPAGCDARRTATPGRRSAGPDVSLGAAAVTAVHGGKRPGKAPVRRLALLRPVSACGRVPSTQDDHLLRSRSASKSTRAAGE